MICSKIDYKEYLKADKIALGNSNKKKPKYLIDGIWKYQILLRKCEYYINCKRGVFSKIILKFLKFKFIILSQKYNFSIPFNVFDKGLSIAHYGSIVVNSNCKIGENCRIHENVTIGVSGDAYWGTQKGNAPIIGNNVFIATGAKIIGKIRIANNVVIGANACVVNSIEEENTTWGGVPAHKISNNGSLDYIKTKR